MGFGYGLAIGLAIGFPRGWVVAKESGRLFTSRAGIQITAKEMVKGGAFFGTFVGVGFGIRC